MLMEGYGCERDPAAGREWVDRARRRGYRMSGVCRVFADPEIAKVLVILY